MIQKILNNKQNNLENKLEILIEYIKYIFHKNSLFFTYNFNIILQFLL